LASSRSEGGTGERGEKDGDKTTKDEKEGQGQEHEKETPIPTRRAATPHLEGDTLTADWEVLETGSGRSALDDDDWAEARLQTEG
jgi:CelD/BcsL family acetyltransferase involved in cellulose biosynthesis